MFLKHGYPREVYLLGQSDGFSHQSRGAHTLKCRFIHSDVFPGRDKAQQMRSPRANHSGNFDGQGNVEGVIGGRRRRPFKSTRWLLVAVRFQRLLERVLC